MSTPGRLDDVLFGGSTAPDLEDALEQVATARLWPGFTNPDAVGTYLSGVSGDPAKLVTSSCLILLHRDSAIFDEAPWRPQVADLLRRQAKDLQPYATTPTERGAHATFTACAGVVAALLADFESLIARITALHQVPGMRNGFMRKLNGRAGSIVLRPFLPQGKVDAALAELFAATAAMTADEVSDQDAAYATIRSRVKRCNDVVDELDTRFARLTVGALAEVVSELATTTIELTKPPAQVTAVVNARPLPLREVGVTCDLLMEVQNTSEVSAQHVVVRAATPSASVALPADPVNVAKLNPKSAVPLTVPVTVLRAESDLDVQVVIDWRNPDQTAGTHVARAQIPAQAADIDWDSVAARQPFAPYPVEEASGLFGRGQILSQLKLQFANPPLGNLYITGQRRVGKTSIVRVLKQQLRSEAPHLLMASVEMGEVRQEGGTDTISQLGAALARKLIRAADAKGAVDVPEFSRSLSPLNDVIDDLRQLDSKFRVLLVIDEFDELPDEMFRRGGPGDAIFLPIRSLAQKPYVGWILVGGERMPFIRDEQATRLNTFSEKRVDYLAFVEGGSSKQNGQESFASLVRTPLPEGFEVDDAAVGQIHTESLGNPHFAKSICAEVFDRAVDARDSMIQLRDVEAAVRSLAGRSDVELFAHFWEDGIFSHSAEDRRRTELERRHVLAAVAEVGREGRATPDRVDAAAVSLGLSQDAARRNRTDLCRRGVLLEESGELRAKVPLFGAWLESEGVYQLAPKGIAERVEGDIRAQDASARVSQRELERLAQRWRGFRFKADPITREDIARWLAQFETPVEKRLMFRLLERFRLVSDAEVIEGWRRLNRLVGHDGVIELDKGQRSLKHVLVSGVGGSGTSGEAMAYKYRQANNVRQRNVVPVGDVASRLESDAGIKAVVLVDDFIGSGKTLSRAIGEIGAVKRKDVQFLAFATSGIPGAVEGPDGPIGEELGLRIEVAYPLTVEQLPFSAESDAFATGEDRARAEQVVRKYGERLSGRMPLGFAQQAALVTFPDNCPNNVPPIFWADTNGWKPLFRRTVR